MTRISKINRENILYLCGLVDRNQTGGKTNSVVGTWAEHEGVYSVGDDITRRIYIQTYPERVDNRTYPSHKGSFILMALGPIPSLGVPGLHSEFWYPAHPKQPNTLPKTIFYGDYRDPEGSVSTIPTAGHANLEEVWLNYVGNIAIDYLTQVDRLRIERLDERAEAGTVAFVAVESSVTPIKRTLLSSPVPESPKRRAVGINDLLKEVAFDLDTAKEMQASPGLYEIPEIE